MLQPADPRVLVVDDEPNIVDVVSMARRFQGFAVESARIGPEAITAVSRFRPDLIVLDVMLPDTEGFDVAQRLGDRVPIIYLTARDATDVGGQRFGWGAVFSLVLPVRSAARTAAR
jgi:two-component system OmpR family response regulator